MMLCSRDIIDTATPIRPRIMARRRQPAHVAAAAASTTLVLPSATAARRRTASVSNGGGAEERDYSVNIVSQLMTDTMTDAATKQNQLKAFAAAMTRPVSSQENRCSFEHLRALMPQRFAELCKVHLSFLIDVPADFLDGDCEAEGRKHQQQQQQHATPGRWLRQHVRSSMKMKLQSGRADSSAANSAGIPQSSVVSSDLAVIESLLAHLSEHADNAAVEGLFRKCGSASRQRHLLDALRTACHAKNVIDMPAAPTATAAAAAAVASCSSHDLAGALKSSLASLGEPLLTDRLLPYFQQVAGLGATPTVASTVEAGDEGRAALLAARRLKGFRLLVQLLPLDRRALLGRLLNLLARTGAAPVTRMTPDSLGTVFGPALFYPRAEASVAGGARQLAEVLNSAAAFLIRHSESVMMIPESIAQDADQILRRIRRSPTTSAISTALPGGPSEDVVSLSVRFAESSVSSRPQRHREEFTRSQVAALYAAVQAMPDSVKRRRLIRRFNRTNGGLPTSAIHLPAGAATTGGCKLDQTPMSPPSSQSPSSPCFSTSPSPPSPLISSPVFGSRVLLDFPMRCLSPGPEM